MLEDKYQIPNILCDAIGLHSYIALNISLWTKKTIWFWNQMFSFAKKIVIA